MEKQIVNYDNFMAAVNSIQKRKMIQFEVADQIFYTKVKTHLTIDDKIKFGELVMNIGAQMGHELKDREFLAFEIAALETLSNLEFPEDSDKKIIFYKGLVDFGVAKRIFETAGTETIQELADFLPKMTDIMSQMLASPEELGLDGESKA